LHLWQLIHDAKESVNKCSKKTLLDKLEQIGGEYSFLNQIQCLEQSSEMVCVPKVTLILNYYLISKT